MKFIGESDSPLYHEVRARLHGATTWRERVERCMPESQFFPPATKSDLEAVQKALGHGIPDDLQEMLAESNGVESRYSSLVYSAARIIEVNQTFRTVGYLADRMPFDHLLFFGTVSDGDEFAFPILRNGGFGDAVFVWSHESDCREEYAMSLADYIAKYTVELYTPYMKNRNSPLRD
jgi:hypothetical protein